jgi:CRISPR/Cas system endoribonuclease Cas6 (RAMP superfamily)
MINSQVANEFANHWIKAWNSHDLKEILSHYADDFEMSSPVIINTMNETSGKLKAKALAKYPDLRFEKLHVLVGANSVTIIYNGVRGLSAEVFHFNDQAKVYAAYAHYDL